MKQAEANCQWPPHIFLPLASACFIGNWPQLVSLFYFGTGGRADDGWADGRTGGMGCSFPPSSVSCRWILYVWYGTVRGLNGSYSFLGWGISRFTRPGFWYRDSPSSFTEHDLLVGVNTAALGYTLDLTGDIRPTGVVYGSVKSFDIAHPDPSKPDMRLRHWVTESNEPGGNLLYRFQVDAVQGNNTIQMPDYFKHLATNVMCVASPVRHFGRRWADLDNNDSNCIILGTSRAGLPDQPPLHMSLARYLADSDQSFQNLLQSRWFELEAAFPYPAHPHRVFYTQIAEVVDTWPSLFESSCCCSFFLLS